ncbi:MAG: H-X9-DG-CTERM domain-containing protein, partial [Verrucomicrobiota bacterium]
WPYQPLSGSAVTRTGLKDLYRQSDFSKRRHAKMLGRPIPASIRGVSYEINNYFSWKIRKTANVGYFQHVHDAFNLQGVRVSPDEIYLMFDGDANGPGSGRHAHNNFPDDWDNHGRDGVNMLMCDGSVKWVNGGYDYMYAYELSQDEGRGINRMPNLPDDPVVN